MSTQTNQTVPRKLRIGLYGGNGHQLTSLANGHSCAEIVAYAGFKLPNQETPGASPVEYSSLESMLSAPSIDLISLCSPRRVDQPWDAIQCLEAGKHVYAEKPCALDEVALDAVLATAQRCGRCFREMGSISHEYPYHQMRERVQSGALGEIVQVFAQKSYPYYPGRVQDEQIDGGILLQVGIHATRMIEYIGGVQIETLQSQEAQVDLPARGCFTMACCIQGKLANGGTFSAILNYLNPMGFARWGNDHLRIFGTKGMIESTDGGAQTRLTIGDASPVALSPAAEGESVDHVTLYFRSILGWGKMPIGQEAELHPLRALLRAER